MNYRSFGRTDLQVSEIGFGAWAIGGPAFAGTMPIGWGETDDTTSEKALHRAFDLGINFYDTADFYGLGHSEELIGRVFGNRSDVIIASKVGQKLGDNKVEIDYSKAYIMQACEDSLHRLRRDTIDYHQLHIAKVAHLEQGECIEAMEQLQQEGKIRYWGISLNTFAPEPEADFFLTHQIGHGFQVVFNILNQHILSYLPNMQAQGYGIIARMPLQFGLLAGKFDTSTTFDANDHRSFRLTPELIETSNKALQPVWELARQYGVSPAELSLSYILSFPEISTIIPGIRTPEQADKNTKGLVQLKPEDKAFVMQQYETAFRPVVEMMRRQG
ncbi:aldo/keto reductase [Nibrella saemangeumensis]|uniref:Aldo/keto reductase n=1 Tax=Nibrella saemangeumensis TaxID=1084526 RepID=A0ABP8NQI5_9BACT